MQVTSEALTKAEMLSPKSKASAGKAQFWALSTSPSLIFIDYIPSLRLKILSRLSLYALYPSPETPTQALLFCSQQWQHWSHASNALQSAVPLFGRYLSRDGDLQ